MTVVFPQTPNHKQIYNDSSGMVYRFDSASSIWDADVANTAAISIKSTEKTISDQATDLSLLYLDAAESKGARMNMRGGIMDPFTDRADVDSASSNNEIFGSGSFVSGPAQTVSPIMTANVTGPYTISASSTYSAASMPAWHAMDENEATKWFTPQGVLTGWIKIDLSVPTIVRSFSVNPSGYGPYSMRNFTFQGSNNNYSWTTLLTLTNHTWVSNFDEMFVLPADANYRYYRLNCTAANGPLWITVGRWRLFPTASAQGSMVVSSKPFTSSIVPTKTRIGMQLSGTFNINNDIIAEVSRDDGVTWATATMSFVGTLASGNSYYEDNSVDMRSTGSGNKLRYKITTSVPSTPVVSGVLLQWT